MSRKRIGGVGVRLYFNITSELDKGMWLNSHPCRLTPGERIPNTN